MIIRRNFYTVIILLVCYLPWQGYGQVRFYTNVSEQSIVRNQTFQVQYTVEGTEDIRDFTIPRFPGFKVEEVFDMHNTVVSNQTNMQPVSSYSKVVVLSTQKKGKYVIPGATAIIAGKRMLSNIVHVTVQASSLPPTSGMSNMYRRLDDDIDVESESVLSPGEDVAKKVHKNFFLRIEASKTTCYVGEPIMVVYKAYSRLNANSQVVKRPSLTGFSVMEMVDSYDSKPEIEKINGVPFYSIIIRKVQLFPLQEGDFALDPAEIESVVHFVKTDNSGSALFNGTPYDYKTTLRTDPLTIKVKPVPTEGQPADFTGAIGQFSLSVVPPRDDVHRGDLVKVQVVVDGSGNLSLITAPHVNWPRGVDTSDPMVKENINKYIYPLSGNKTFEYSLTAPDTGNIVIPPAHLSYFDPETKTYKTATSDPVNLRVLVGLSKEKEDSLKTAMASAGKKPGIPLHYYWFGLIVTVIIGWIVFQLVRSRKSKKQVAETPVVMVPVQQQPVIIEKAPAAAETLAVAQRAMEQGNHILFYREVQQVLWKTAAAKCQVLPSALNKQNTARELLAKGTDPLLVQDFSNILQECEWALYTPSVDRQDMAGTLNKAESVIDGLQKA